MPTAFVTGGTGFLGGHLLRQLISAGWQVTALHRPTTDPTPLRQLGATPVAADLTDPDRLRQVLPEGVDAIFHTAGNTSMWKRQAEVQYRDNVEGTRALVRAALDRGARRFVHTSSVSAFGSHRQRIDETTPSNAEHHWISYHRTKYLAEQQVRAARAQGLDGVILNPCAIVGAGDRHNWSQMIRLIQEGRLPGIPPGTGSFCHVEEVARVHLQAALRAPPHSQYLLAGVEASFLELAQTIARLLGRPVPTRTVPRWLLSGAARVLGWMDPLFREEPRLTPEKVAMVTERTCADDRRAVQELGFQAHIPLERMLQECIDWMRAEGLLPTTQR